MDSKNSLKLDGDFAASIQDILESAGDIALKYFKPEGLDKSRIVTKDDLSPVTNVDLLINKHLTERLKVSYGLPVLSEETKESYALVENSGSFFIIDPIDGTKEYIDGSEDFVINLALIYAGNIMAGFIYAPATNELWYAIHGDGAIKLRNKRFINKLKISNNREYVVGITSKNHTSEFDIKVSKALGCNTFVKRGSAIKFCLIAQGDADIYVRMGNTMIWDTVAAELIIRSAGGQMYYVDNENNLVEKHRQLLNNGFVCTNRPLSSNEIKKIQLIIND